MNYNGYVNRKSPIHRFNPSLKFISSIILIVLIFIPYGFFLQVILFFIIMALYFIAKLPIRKLFKIVVSILVMMFILLIVNWITYKGPGVVFDFDSKAYNIFGYDFNMFGKHAVKINDKWFLQGYMWGGNPLTGTIKNDFPSLQINDASLLEKLQEQYVNNQQGFYYFGPGTDLNVISDVVKQFKKLGYAVTESGAYSKNLDYFIYVYKTNWYALSSFAITLIFTVSMKIFLMILVVTILTSTTSSVELTYALEDILNPLRVFKLPVTVWSTTIALGIRFIPSLLDESDRIMKAQASRGLDFKNGNFKDKIVSLTSFIVPLFSIAFKKADELANAMEARGFNPRYTRTRYREYEIKIVDWIGYLILTLFLGMIIALTFISTNQRVVYISPFGLLEIVSMFGM